MTSIADRYATYAELLPKYGQSHLLRFWNELNDAQRAQLLADLDQVPLDQCYALIETYVRQRPKIDLPKQLDPPDVLPVRPDAARADLFHKGHDLGVKALREGRVAAFTVAGGQGTRLGFEGPKGAFQISPVRDATLFQLFAESLLGIERRFGRRPRWYVMTSPGNHEATVSFFEQNRWFGLSDDDVMFFRQGQMPAFLPDGRIAMAAKHQLALSPNGHGGSLQALRDSGALGDMSERGIEHISYFQVDNPLVRTLDPMFIGLHLAMGSQMSSKAVTKAADTERVGNFCLADGKLQVIEYSDLPEELALQKNPDGSRRFDAGSIAVHVLSRAFVESLTDPESSVHLPWHRADKKVPVIDDAGDRVQPPEPNVVKLEMFVFDAIPLARNAMVMYTDRAEEFSPVKNADGVDSPATARRDLIRRAARWLESCGCVIPWDASGEPQCAVEISPAFATDAEDLREQLREPLTIEPNQSVVLP